MWGLLAGEFVFSKEQLHGRAHRVPTALGLLRACSSVGKKLCRRCPLRLKELWGYRAVSWEISYEIPVGSWVSKYFQSLKMRPDLNGLMVWQQGFPSVWFVPLLKTQSLLPSRKDKTYWIRLSQMLTCKKHGFTRPTPNKAAQLLYSRWKKKINQDPKINIPSGNFPLLLWERFRCKEKLDTE